MSTAPSPLPRQMPALVVASHQGGSASLRLETVPVPEPGPGQVLIAVSHAPVNPNDLLALANAYEVARPVGSVAGFEGSGTVVGGTGLMARLLAGRRVAFIAHESGGTWAEYSTALAMQCVPLRKKVDLVQGATLLTNPMTALVLLRTAHQQGHTAIIQAAAAGALGTMMARLAPTLGLTMVHLVRRPAQVEALEALGAEHVVDSSVTGWVDQLQELGQRLGATLALDPIGGPTTGVLLRALRPGGVVRVYGWLSGQPSEVAPDELLFRQKQVEGFTMYDWVAATSALGQVAMAVRAQGLLSGPLSTEVGLEAGLEAYEAALDGPTPGGPGAKVLFVPGGKS